MTEKPQGDGSVRCCDNGDMDEKHECQKSSTEKPMQNDTAFDPNKPRHCGRCGCILFWEIYATYYDTETGKAEIEFEMVHINKIVNTYKYWIRNVTQISMYYEKFYHFNITIWQVQSQ